MSIFAMGQSMVLVKNLKFCERFVFCNIHPEKVFGDVLVRKQACLDNINIDFLKKAKLAFLQRGQSMIFVQKVKFFHLLCLSKIHREKVFADVLNKKESFKDYKNNRVRKAENQNFFKGVVHRFGQKFEISSTLIFVQNR